MAYILHICTVPVTLGFLEGLLPFLEKRGHRVLVVTSPGPELDAFAARTGIAVHPLPMERGISPVRDVVSLIRLIELLLRERPNFVHSHTPKAGLLGMVAALLTAVPGRIYHLRGLRLSTTRGLTRAILKTTERIASGAAHLTIAVSPSLLAEARREGVVWSSEAIAMRSGQGVDALGRFSPTESRSRGAALRTELGIPANAVVIGFVGRFVRDKGLVELMTAWRSLRSEFPELRMLLAGDADDTDPVDLSELFADERVHHVPFTRDTPRVYEALDILAFPTYREGFPNVVLEAAAMEVPAVASDAVGSIDSVVDGVTGILVKAHDAESLRRGLAELVRSAERRSELGHSARERVLRDFGPLAIFDTLARVYEDQ